MIIDEEEVGYATIVIYVWKIPTGSLGLVAGGLSAGIGLAMKQMRTKDLYGHEIVEPQYAIKVVVGSIPIAFPQCDVHLIPSSSESNINA